MGYSTDFSGKFNLNKELTIGLHLFLVNLNKTRRVATNADNKVYGYEGEYDVHQVGKRFDNNRQPSTQPNLYCQWVPTKDGLSIEWDGNEKFYGYIEWLSYIIHKILIPNYYVLNGKVTWQGEEVGDVGEIEVIDNEIHVHQFKKPSYIHPINMNMRLDYPLIDKGSQPKVKAKSKTKKELEAIIVEQAKQIEQLKMLLNERNN